MRGSGGTCGEAEKASSLPQAVHACNIRRRLWAAIEDGRGVGQDQDDERGRSVPCLGRIGRRPARRRPQPRHLLAMLCFNLPSRYPRLCTDRHRPCPASSLRLPRRESRSGTPVRYHAAATIGVQTSSCGPRSHGAAPFKEPSLPDKTLVNGAAGERGPRRRVPALHPGLCPWPVVCPGFPHDTHCSLSCIVPFHPDHHQVPRALLVVEHRLDPGLLHQIPVLDEIRPPIRHYQRLHHRGTKCH